MPTNIDATSTLAGRRWMKEATGLARATALSSFSDQTKPEQKSLGLIKRFVIVVMHGRHGADRTEQVRQQGRLACSGDMGSHDGKVGSRGGPAEVVDLLLRHV